MALKIKGKKKETLTARTNKSFSDLDLWKIEQISRQVFSVKMSISSSEHSIVEPSKEVPYIRL